MALRTALIEQRFAAVMGQAPGDMPSIAVTNTEHQVFTNAWHQAISYGLTGTGMATQLPYAPGCEIAMQIGASERNIDSDPGIAWHDRDIRKVGISRYNAFGQRETDREILQIIRRCHHHGIRKSAVAEGDRRFFRDADQPPLLAARSVASRVYGDRDAGIVCGMLKRSVHCAIRM